MQEQQRAEQGNFGEGKELHDYRYFEGLRYGCEGRSRSSRASASKSL